MNEPKIETLQEGDQLLPNGQIRKYITARFMVGPYGPFTAVVDKVDGWQTALRLELDKQARDVNSLTP